MASDEPISRVPIQRIDAGSPTDRGAMALRTDGVCVVVMRVSSVNVDMKEQDALDALMSTFGGLLAGLPIGSQMQVLSRTSRQDPDAYFQPFQARLADPRVSELEKEMIDDHVHHVAREILERNLLDHETFIALSAPTEKPSASRESALGDVPGAAGARRWQEARNQERDQREPREPTELGLAMARETLNDRIEHIEGMLNRVEIRCEPLGEDDLLELLYGQLHPGLSQRQRYHGGAGVASLADAGPRRVTRAPLRPDAVRAPYTPNGGRPPLPPR